MNDFFDNQRILRLIWKRKIHFIIIGLTAIIISAIFSSPVFIKPKFKSTARIYPSNLWVVSEESETEQLLEIINSKDIKLKMFDTFDLDKVYKVDRKDPRYMTYMLNIYEKNVKTNKTNFETAEIQVLDHDPQRASDMCDSLIHFYNKKVRDMHKRKDFEMVTIARKGLKQKYSELDTLIYRLDTLKQNYGILDFKSQVEKVTEGYMTALAEGRASQENRSKIQNLYNNLAEQGTQAYWLESRFNYLIDVIDSLTTQHEFYLAEYEKDITYCYVVENPVPADKKSYPVRWLIVSLSVLSALFLALLVFLVLDYQEKINF
ncbi:MAG: Wzz/FepE/Etk N-terminal domain-containing protein [Prolixibacteraceae bacterium]|nr:Wzz/FepE/Etk N-terminal domain-containing protein [Prolixibacteraceae bacterium]